MQQQIEEFADRFWAWRAWQMPRGRDDIPRLQRPPGWLPEVDPAVIERRREEAARFGVQLAALHPVEVADRIDHRLLRSALARVRWESDVLQVRRIPRYWIDQAVGPVFDALLRPGVDAARVAEVVRLLRAVPATLAHAQPALAGAAREYADLAIGELDGVDDRLSACADALASIAPALAADLHSAARDAGAALLDLRRWLVTTGFAAAEPVGADAYEWFLREVACVPLSVGEIADIGRREYERAVWLELLRANAARNVALPPLPADAAAQVATQGDAERQVRDFSVQRRLLSQPGELRHYLNLPMPAYLEPLRFLGVSDDLTGPDRLDEDGIAYVPAPVPALPYFYAANARDPRAGIVHEGVHSQQLALSWAHARPVRQHYYDSGANEGIAFYNEEMMLTAGLFDDAPHTRTALCNFMRLRALRVTVDVGLATGAMSIEDAAGALESRVPMDRETAREEAAFFAESPGQALSYQIGKTQLIALIADAVRVRGADLDLQALHDAIWVNGNVPIALLRWELLGLTDELDAIGVDPAA